MHSSLHISRPHFLKLVESNKSEVTDINIIFNYPKNPHAPGDARVYKKPIGGCMLDLGVYVFQMAKEIGQVLGFDLFSFDKENKDIYIKKTPDGVDFEVVANLNYNGIKVRLETKINPGTNHTEEASVTLKNGDKITQNQFTHQHDSNGVFLEKLDGTCQFI
jgi:predicted dehydrogenase